ncbi:hypothetical protein RFI_04822 [Reticulomyxa filosa]|uniref:YegS/DAGK C-terminal domain-containing protein n=1 Tax=Reticulomyxa filosa TaxID=46433 RepID=X6P2J4_RETFI|nr:hypothetical protein RFI_04822 [Reticulomyxa filosa]|eukprot:ETO32299.1 hypothetical protein RFI_04822 [Reticulomyxa filosa]
MTRIWKKVISGNGELKKLSCLKMTDKQGNVLYASSMVYWGVPSDTAENSNHPLMRNVFGGARYDICAVYQILKFSSRFVTLKIDDGKYMIDLDLIVFAALNGKYFGKGLMICPFAKMDSEYMDLALLCRTTRASTAALFSKLPTGESFLNSSYEKNGIMYIRCKKCELIPFHGLDSCAGIDGEIGLKTPLLIEVVPNTIPLLL